MVRKTGPRPRSNAAKLRAISGAAIAMMGLAACGGSCPAPATAVAPIGPLSGYAFLSGTWIAEADDGAHTEETWTVPRGTVMPGSSHTEGADGATRTWESLRIERRGELVYYVAQQSDAQGETAFQAVELGEGRAVFENAAHDYPQRITYELESDGVLRATVSDLDGVHRESWRLHREAR